MATFAKELNLTPSRVSQLKKRGVFMTVEIDGVDHISRAEADRFKNLQRRPGRKPKIPLSPMKVAELFLGASDDDSGRSPGSVQQNLS